MDVMGRNVCRWMAEREGKPNKQIWLWSLLRLTQSGVCAISQERQSSQKNVLEIDDFPKIDPRQRASLLLEESAVTVHSTSYVPLSRQTANAENPILSNSPDASVCSSTHI